MITKVFIIYKIELIKLFKRKDWLALLSLVALGLMLGAAVSSKGYTGPNNQSALYWTTSQVFNSSAMFVTPLIFSFIATRTLASEIENKSILLYTSRFRNRKNIYIGKNLAIVTFATLTFFIVCFINLVIYYALVCRNESIASGSFLGENTLILIIFLVALYVSSFILSTQFSLFLSAFYKSPMVIGIVFSVVLVLHNTFRIPYLRELNPWYYIVRISSMAFKTEKVNLDYGEVFSFIVPLIMLCIVYSIIFNFLAIKKFKSSDL